MSVEHEAGHAAVEADDGWRGHLDYARLLVHLARHHNLTEADVDNAGLAVLLGDHDDHHESDADVLPAVVGRMTDQGREGLAAVKGR